MGRFLVKMFHPVLKSDMDNTLVFFQHLFSSLYTLFTLSNTYNTMK